MEPYEYAAVISPSNLFESEEELQGFIELNPMELEPHEQIEALQSFLKECEQEECYEFCSIILATINKLKHENKAQ